MTCCVIVAQGHAWPGFITHMGYDTAGARACLLATAEATMNVIRPRVSTAGRRQRQAVAPCPPDRQRGTSRREALHRRHRGSRHPGMTVPHDVRGLRLPCPLACPLTAVMLALLLPPPRNDSKQMPGNVTEYQMNSHYGSEGQLKPNLRTDTTRAKLWREAGPDLKSCQGLTILTVAFICKKPHGKVLEASIGGGLRWRLFVFVGSTTVIFELVDVAYRIRFPASAALPVVPLWPTFLEYRRLPCFQRAAGHHLT